MRDVPAVQPLPELRGVSPLDVAARWPADRRLMMLHSGRVHPRWARWSILASPRATWRFDGASRWIGQSPSTARNIRFANDPLVDLDAVLNSTTLNPQRESEAALPFFGGWIGYFSYDLGRWIEPRAQHKALVGHAMRWPLIELAWCPDALLFDHLRNEWTAVGNVEAVVESALLAVQHGELHEQFDLSELHASTEAKRYESIVARAIEYIAAGDIFQANIAQQFTAGFSGSPRALMAAAMEYSRPWYGAHLELAAVDDEPSRTIISLSPELFLKTDPATRRVITRPIKGTRPVTDKSGGGARELIDSAKDAAELHMIVDLMRNDLGRVCQFGSVEVVCARTIETHPTVYHGVGEITGTLRHGVTMGELLRATFPGGSITGAPKIRAMQIIDELEGEQRGPYCGAIGFISDCGAASLNIAIRTMLLTNRSARKVAPGHDCGSLDYWAGAGIVADSDPHREHAECLDKAAVVMQLCASAEACKSIAAR